MVSTRDAAILVPVDFSPESLGLARFARDVARRSGARLTLLHVDAVPPFGLDVTSRAPAHVSDAYLRDRAAALRRSLEELRCSVAELPRDDDIEAVLVRDDVVAAIVGHAAATGVVLLVMASQNSGGAARRVDVGLGAQIADRAACPILYVPEAALARLPAAGAFQRPLVAVSDPSGAYRLAQALDVVTARGGCAELVHVFEPVAADDPEIEEFVPERRRPVVAGLEHVARAVRAKGLRCSFGAELGTPESELLQRLLEQRNDLLVLQRGHHAAGTMLGCAAERMLRAATTPVILTASDP